VFDAGGRAVASTMRLWPSLLVLAVLLNLAELVLRKWRSIAATLAGRHPAATVAASDEPAPERPTAAGA